MGVLGNAGEVREPSTAEPKEIPPGRFCSGNTTHSPHLLTTLSGQPIASLMLLIHKEGL
jgi:hypothetical protein